MPNWTTNIITLKHSDASKIDAIMATDGTDTGILEILIPMPQELNITAGFFGDSEKQAELERQEQANLAKYGFKNWYDWNIAHWGTKWDLCEPSLTRVDDNTVTISCQTAWSPPTTAFETLVEQDWEVRALYVGEGMEYAGIWEPGNDEYYSNFANSKHAAKILPQELDDAFSIVEQIEEYERENEEELTQWIKDGIEERKEDRVSDPEDI